MEKKLVLLLIFLLTQLLSLETIAQDTEVVVSKTTFTGNADFYYRFNFANTGNANEFNNKTVFTNSHDSFELGMASIKATHKYGKASVVADLGFGTRVKEFNYNDKNNEFLVKQLNMTYEFTEKFKITMGTFTSHIGYELLDATDNKNYSMSYAFTNGPFFNTGIKAQYTFGKFSVMAGISNPTDFKSATASGSSRQKTIIGKLGYTVEKGSIFLNFTTGSNNPNTKNNHQIDFLGIKKLNDKMTLGINGTFAVVNDDVTNLNQNWFAAIAYAQYIFAKKTSLAYRLEYFDDKDGAKYTNANLNVISNTLSLNYKEGNFTFIPEIRFDYASKYLFVKNNAFEPSKSVGSFLFATTYSF